MSSGKLDLAKEWMIDACLKRAGELIVEGADDMQIETQLRVVTDLHGPVEEPLPKPNLQPINSGFDPSKYRKTT